MKKIMIITALIVVFALAINPIAAITKESKTTFTEYSPIKEQLKQCLTGGEIQGFEHTIEVPTHRAKNSGLDGDNLGMLIRGVDKEKRMKIINWFVEKMKIKKSELRNKDENQGYEHTITVPTHRAGKRGPGGRTCFEDVILERMAQIGKPLAGKVLVEPHPAETRKMSVYESGGWMKIMKSKGR